MPRKWPNKPCCIDRETAADSLQVVSTDDVVHAVDRLDQSVQVRSLLR